MKSDFRVAVFVNSFVGRPGNIGARTTHVLAELKRRRVRSACICRGLDGDAHDAKLISMGLLGHAPRILNAFRIYAHTGFDHKTCDIGIFDLFSRRAFRSSNLNRSCAVAHVWESCPRLISACKAAGARVVLDVPIAPNTYPKRLRENGSATFFQYSDKLIELEREAFRLADQIIVPSDFVRAELLSSGVEPAKISVVEFGVDSTMPEAGHLTQAIDLNQGIKFCFLGTVNFRKGIRELLEVWGDNAFERDSLTLYGRVFPQVQELLARARVSNVYTPGHVDPKVHLPSCNVFVFPSWMEGSAKAVYEAMACGLPVIASSAAGSVARHGTDGFIIEPGDIDALKRAMLWFKKNPTQIATMGQAARARARQFTWRRYAERVVDQYGCNDEKK